MLATMPQTNLPRVLNDAGEAVVAEGELDCIADDAALLISIACHLPVAWELWHQQRHTSAPFIISQEDTHCQSLRTVVCAAPETVCFDHDGPPSLHEAKRNAYDPAARPALTPLPFVGFVSQARYDLSADLVDAIAHADRRLVAQLGTQPDILAYSSLEVGAGAWCNLVLFRNVQGKETVTHLPGHREAAYMLAPRYYRWIRLHHGTVTLAPQRPKLWLERTTFYTFQDHGLPPLLRTEIYTEAAAARAALRAAHRGARQATRRGSSGDEDVHALVTEARGEW
jgi:hypothetical protein